MSNSKNEQEEIAKALYMLEKKLCEIHGFNELKVMIAYESNPLPNEENECQFSANVPPREIASMMYRSIIALNEATRGEFLGMLNQAGKDGLQMTDLSGTVTGEGVTH